MLNNSFQSFQTKSDDKPKQFNVNSEHPLIPNSQDYIFYKKYVSIHSEDRNYLKYADPSTFEIELPEDLLNVVSMRLASWTFPANYDTIASINFNAVMTFRIQNPYNPAEHGLSSLLQEQIYKCLLESIGTQFTITCQDGFYNPVQMATTLTNKFNEAVTNRIVAYLRQNNYNDLADQYIIDGGYTNFVMAYDYVGQKIWFGNRCDMFILTNQTRYEDQLRHNIVNCYPGRSYEPDYSNWGLPGNLGFNKCTVESLPTTATDVRFYYGDLLQPGDNGFWITPNPNLPGSQIYYVTPPFKINLMGPAFIYMSIDGHDCIDVTSPYNFSFFTAETNETNGKTNTAFAKIPIPATPISQFFDRDSQPYKLYMPPAERIRRLTFRFRYHNGRIVNFGVFNFSFMLEFTLAIPQGERKFNSWLTKGGYM